jgi:F420-dependent oxidoreductase-like protein
MNPARRPLMISPRYGSVCDLSKRVQIADRLGVDQLWLEQQPDQRDALTIASAYLTAAPTATVGTAVLPIYARHPVAMAQAAATLSELSGGRFILGLGLSHQFINEYVLGQRQGPPIAAVGEYVSIVRALLIDGVVNTEGRIFTARAQYANPHQAVPIYLAALRPQMIRLAVRLGDGIILWLCSEAYLLHQVMPAVRAACAEFGRDERDFTVLNVLPAYSGDRLDEQRAAWRKLVASYRLLPYYRHVIENGGRVPPDELALIGAPGHIRDRLTRYRELGCLPVPSPMPGTSEEFTETVEAVYGA